MAEQEQTQAPRRQASSSSSEGKQSKRGAKRGPGLAPVQGDYSDDRPAERRPGTREHLGEDPVYGGEPVTTVESEEDARNR